jgi:hypothetical protein
MTADLEFFDTQKLRIFCSIESGRTTELIRFGSRFDQNLFRKVQEKSGSIQEKSGYTGKHLSGLSF